MAFCRWGKCYGRSSLEKNARRAGACSCRNVRYLRGKFAVAVCFALRLNCAAIETNGGSKPPPYGLSFCGVRRGNTRNIVPCHCALSNIFNVSVAKARRAGACSCRKLQNPRSKSQKFFNLYRSVVSVLGSISKAWQIASTASNDAPPIPRVKIVINVLYGISAVCANCRKLG